MKNPRQIRYNQKTDATEQLYLKHNWTFFIINAKREANEITQKILNYFSTNTDFSACDELEKLETGILIKKGSLIGKLLTLKSNTGIIKQEDRQKINATNKWYYDRTLKPMNDIELDNYATKFQS